MNKKTRKIKQKIKTTKHSLTITSDLEDLDNPWYANHVIIRYSPIEYVFEFYFVDPGIVDKAIKGKEKEIKISPISRIAMPLDRAKKFFEVFKDTIDKVIPAERKEGKK